MEKIKILVVEDDPIIAYDLEQFLIKLNFEVIGVLSSGEDAIMFVSNNIPDIILMDIMLEGDLDGIDVAHEISKNYLIPIIFLTSNTDDRTFNRAKLTQPYGFLSKPFRPVDLKHSLNLAFTDRERNPEAVARNEQDVRTAQIEDCIFIKEKDYLVKISLSNILYIEADSCYCKIFTVDKSYLIVSTLKKFESAVQFENLVRVHRSYIVNLKAINKIAYGNLVIKNTTIPIGRSYREQINQIIPKY